MKRILHGVAIALLTIGLLAFFLWKSNPRVVWRVIESASVPWLMIALFTNGCALVFRTLRWRTILDPDRPPPFYPTFFANAIGYMVSSIVRIPAEFIRAVLLSRRTSFRTAGALGTALTERVLDLFGLLILFVYFVVMHWNDWRNERSFVIIKSAAIVAISVLAALTAFMIGLYFFSGFVRRIHEWLGRVLPTRFRSSWMHFFDTFVETLSLTRQPVAFIKVLSYTAAVWLCLSAPFWFVTIAMRRRLPFDSSFFVNAITTVGLAVPTPGGVGGFHKACQLVLTTFYDFDVDSSVAVAIVFHLVGTIPVLVTGLVLFIHEGMRWRDVREIKAAEE
ncbi:MAG: lysylphosphatidylglycerol synthase transmembrane domain-containing protein [Thermoanaerobaculia bacterium]